ncbi:MAG: hypothetical protein AOA65_0951 [Candidatus Bathyarchaeota archaeon BA1]|nr:MAG: hypothetical protein AOA65_0951 [Candidatus Bathyarchaeota archaeon BA1]
MKRPSGVDSNVKMARTTDFIMLTTSMRGEIINTYLKKDVEKVGEKGK